MREPQISQIFMCLDRHIQNTVIVKIWKIENLRNEIPNTYTKFTIQDQKTPKFLIWNPYKIQQSLIIWPGQGCEVVEAWSENGVLLSGQGGGCNVGFLGCSRLGQGRNLGWPELRDEWGAYSAKVGDMRWQLVAVVRYRGAWCICLARAGMPYAQSWLLHLCWLALLALVFIVSHLP